jgi:hypothetical protein
MAFIKAFLTRMVCMLLAFSLISDSCLLTSP